MSIYVSIFFTKKFCTVPVHIGQLKKYAGLKAPFYL